MSTTLLRLRDVVDRTKLAKTTIYKWMGEKRFPQSIELAPSVIRWDESEVEAWISARRPQAPSPSVSDRQHQGT